MALVAMALACGGRHTSVYITASKHLAGAELYVDGRPVGTLSEFGEGSDGSIQVEQGATQVLEIRHSQFPTARIPLHYSSGATEDYLRLRITADGTIAIAAPPDSLAPPDSVERSPSRTSPM